MSVENQAWDLAMQRSLGTLQSCFSVETGQNSESSRERKRKLKNHDSCEQKPLLKGRLEWTWSWRGSVRSREGFFVTAER